MKVGFRVRVLSWVLVGRVILIDKWSEVSAVMVSQVVCRRCVGRLSRRRMSSDECFWLGAVGRRVDESVLIVE